MAVPDSGTAFFCPAPGGHLSIAHGTGLPMVICARSLPWLPNCQKGFTLVESYPVINHSYPSELLRRSDWVAAFDHHQDSPTRMAG